MANEHVCDVMTGVHNLFTVRPGLLAERVDDMAQERGIRHVFVADRWELRGLVCRCDLNAPDARSHPVGDLMATRFWSVPPGTSLRAAAKVMADHHVGCLPVVASDELVGVVTRGDLRRAGVAEQLLGAGHCAACGSVHGVLPLWEGSDVEFCLNCIEVARDHIDYGELGSGD